MLRVLPVQLYKWLEDIVTENEHDLGLIHPVLPNQVSRTSPVRSHVVVRQGTHAATATELFEGPRRTAPIWQPARNHRTRHPQFHGEKSIRSTMWLIRSNRQDAGGALSYHSI